MDYALSGLLMEFMFFSMGNTRRFNKTLQRKVRGPDGFPHPQRVEYHGKAAEENPERCQ
jgi:hypothetical protein